MEVGLNNYIKRLASELFIKPRSLERRQIDNSISILVSKLNAHFNDQIDKVIVFGSYTRDTILPRNFDQNSDIDLMVQYSNKYERLNPESYRTQLRKFAGLNYSKSIVLKDHPAIVIELNHIKFDLVPAIFDEGWIYDSIEIPDKNGGWMETEPNKFNSELTESNKQYSFVVKPIIRLLKYWNASHGYPFYSYELEKTIASFSFSGDNYESGFLYAIDKLNSYDLPDWGKQKVESLKKNAEVVKDYLSDQNIEKAKRTLKRILPLKNDV